MRWRGWISVTLVTVLGARAVHQGQHVEWAILPDIDLNLPSQPPIPAAEVPGGCWRHGLGVSVK
jgi:hypothetical protein